MKLSELTREYLSPQAQDVLAELDKLFERLRIQFHDARPATYYVEPWMVEDVRNRYHESLPSDSPEREEYRRAMHYERVGDEIAVLRHRYEQAIAGYSSVGPLPDEVMEQTFHVMVELRGLRKNLGYEDERADALWTELQNFMLVAPDPTPTNDSSEEHHG